MCNKIKLSDLEDNKKSISKETTNLNKYKDDITDEIDKNPGVVIRKIDENMAMQHYLKTGNMNRLYD